MLTGRFRGQGDDQSLVGAHVRMTIAVWTVPSAAVHLVIGPIGTARGPTRRAEYVATWHCPSTLWHLRRTPSPLASSDGTRRSDYVQCRGGLIELDDERSGALGDRWTLHVTIPPPSGKSSAETQGSKLGCLSVLGVGFLILVFWTAVAFTFYFFIFFFYPRLLIAHSGWKMSPDGATLASYATLAVPVVGALWFAFAWGVPGFFFGAWMGVGVSFWLQWALQDSFPDGHQPKIPRAKWA